MASKYFYRFKANGEPMLCERPDTTPGRESWAAASAPKEAPKETPKESDKGAVRTNMIEKRNNGVYLDPDRLRKIAITEYGKDVTLYDLIHDPWHHTHEWDMIYYLMTGKREYKSEYDKRMDDLIRHMMD
jgi:hypothetical protein